MSESLIWDFQYAIMFYVGIWYKEVYEEAESAKQKLKQIMNSSEMSDKEKRKFEKKSARVSIFLSSSFLNNFDLVTALGNFYLYYLNIVTSVKYFLVQ